MKTLKEIRAQAQKNGKTIKELKAEFDALKWSEQTDVNRGVKICKKITLLKVENAILSDNEKRVFCAEVLPVFVEIWNKYAGKKYGEKTSDKIKNDFYTATGSRKFYITPGGSYGFDKLTIFQLNEQGYYLSGAGLEIQLNADSNKRLIDCNNTIQAITADALRLSGAREYTEDVKQRANDIIKAFNAVRKINRDLSDAMSKYNDIRPGKSEYLHDPVSLYDLDYYLKR